MAKKPNASNITHALAQFGGGAKKDGGSGMMGGVENIFKVGVEYGAQLALNGSQAVQSIETSNILQLGDGNNNQKDK